MRCSGRSREAGVSFSFGRLTETDELTATAPFSELNTLALHFGRSLLNVSPRDIPRLSAAVGNDHSEEISELIGSSDVSSNATGEESELQSVNVFRESFFKMAVEDCKTEWVEYFLDMISEKSIPFDIGASMMKESYNNLWLDYKIHIEDMIKKDVFGWDICTIEVPIETFTIESNLGSRVGTCNTRLEWIHSSRQGAAFEHWRSLNTKGVDKVLKKSRGRKVNAIVRMYCVEDACQIGLEGMVRYLLIHKAPSSLYKTTLIKWVVAFKWERFWKVFAFKRLAFYLLFVVAFHIFVFVLTVEEFNYPYTTVASLFVCSLVVVALFPVLTLRREYLQLKTCVHDGRKLFPLDYFRGITNYLRSRQNQIDLTLSVALVFLLSVLAFPLHARLRPKEDYRIFFTCLALGLLLVWAKAFYLAQALKRSGIFVVMIGRVLQECTPYLLMLLGITIAFGVAMRVAFLEVIQELEYSYPHRARVWKVPDYLSAEQKTYMTVKDVFDSEGEHQIHTSFGSLQKSILTMTYAMVGLFDPEVLVDCGVLRGVMTAIFVLYLLLQSIVMFNMLIASMGDAFDGVRAEEEELFLMARAKFIDQYEASLTKKEIQKMKSKIGKYLYVLIPEDKQLEDNVPFWKGRISTIKEDVTKIVTDSHNEMHEDVNKMSLRMNEMFTTLKDDIKNEIKNDLKSLEERVVESLEERITKALDERLTLLEQRIANPDSIH